MPQAGCLQRCTHAVRVYFARLSLQDGLKQTAERKVDRSLWQQRVCGGAWYVAAPFGVGGRTCTVPKAPKSSVQSLHFRELPSAHHHQAGKENNKLLPDLFIARGGSLAESSDACSQCPQTSRLFPGRPSQHCNVHRLQALSLILYADEGLHTPPSSQCSPRPRALLDVSLDLRPSPCTLHSGQGLGRQPSNASLRQHTTLPLVPQAARRTNASQASRQWQHAPRQPLARRRSPWGFAAPRPSS